MSNYRQDLFSTYHTRIELLDKSAEEKLNWFRWYFHHNYRAHLPDLALLSSLNILEIGCNRGYLLRVLAELGCKQLNGIDLSPADLEVAREICPKAALSCIDAFDFLEVNKSKFSIIFMKAVLEHIPKDRVMSLIESISQSLEPGGRLIVDVPNMDWLFATHERYMDFTHEVGFTRESLTQVMRNYFDCVSVYPIETSRTRGIFRSWLKSSFRFALSVIFWAAQTEWPGTVVWYRALIGVGVKNQDGNEKED